MKSRLAIVVARAVRPLALLTVVGLLAAAVALALLVRGGALILGLFGFAVIGAAFRAVTARGPAQEPPQGVPCERADLRALVADEAAALGVAAPAILLTAGRDVRLDDGVIAIGAMTLAERSPAQFRVAVTLALLGRADATRRRLRGLRDGVVAGMLGVGEAHPYASLPWHWGARLADRLLGEALDDNTLGLVAAAARRHGAALVGAELRASARDPRFERYWGGFVVPCLRAGFRPPLVDGWRRAITSPSAVLEFAHCVTELAEEPTFAQAVATAAREGAGVVAPDSPAEWDGLELPEAAILAARDRAELVPVSWPHVGAAVLVPDMRAAVRADAWFAGATVGDLAELEPPEPSDDDADALYCALVVALADAGWEVVIEPADGARLESEDFGLEAAGLAVDAAAGALDGDAWRGFAAEAGIADVPLCAPPPPADTAPELEALAALAPPVTIRIPIRATRALRIRTAITGVVIALLTLPLAAMSASAAFTPGLPAGAGTFILGLAATLVVVPAGCLWLRVWPVFRRGSLVIDSEWLRIEHRALLRRPYELPRRLLCAVVVDDGDEARDADGRRARFAIAASVWEDASSARAGIAGWLWSAGAYGIVPQLSVANDPPNLALVFSDAVGGPVTRQRTDAGPQKGEAIGGLLLSVIVTPELRDALADAGFGPRIEREDVLRLWAAFNGEPPAPADREPVG